MRTSAQIVTHSHWRPWPRACVRAAPAAYPLKVYAGRDSYWQRSLFRQRHEEVVALQHFAPSSFAYAPRHNTHTHCPQFAVASRQLALAALRARTLRANASFYAVPFVRSSPRYLESSHPPLQQASLVSRLSPEKKSTYLSAHQYQRSHSPARYVLLPLREHLKLYRRSASVFALANVHFFNYTSIRRRFVESRTIAAALAYRSFRATICLK